MSLFPSVCLLGFGEVGQILASDLRGAGVTDLVSYDVLFRDGHSGPTRAARIAQVEIAGTAVDAAAGVDVIISVVTAAQDLAAAQSVVAGMRPGTYFLDLNSVSPEVKVQVATLIDGAGGRCVEAAIMSPISPKRIGSPMLFGGPHAARFLPLAKQLGFSGAEVYSDRIGRASAAKMCRSVMIKGIEALLAESLLTARHYGVEAEVLQSLQALVPSANWSTHAHYMISRSLIHGRRRAEEMREATCAVSDAGISPLMSSATAQRQDWAAGFAEQAASEELGAMLDGLRERMRTRLASCSETVPERDFRT